MRNTLYTVSLVLLCLVLSSWGATGHKKISQNVAACLPAEMSFLKPVWTSFVANHASDADSRKSQDPNESPRHYIDIDNYPEFVLSGHIPQTYDSVVAQFGAGFVTDQGTLPWATMITFDSLKNCFQRRDWNRSAIFAADLGHYVGDGHMPLHITKNYNGQLTNQKDIHSRYESTMVGKYEAQIVYPADPAHYVQDVGGYVFNYLYYDYKYVDSVLLADTYATTLAGGSTGSTAYYQALWAKSGNFTILMMRNASASLADLIYTAWVQAGKPMMYPNAVDDRKTMNQPSLLEIYPNPAKDVAWFPVVMPDPASAFSLEIYDLGGNLKDTIIRKTASAGMQKISWKIGNLVPGTYVCVLKSGSYQAVRNFIVSR